MDGGIYRHPLFSLKGGEIVEVTISQMIDLVEDFVDESEWYGRKTLTVGGIIGTSIFKNVINAVIKTKSFEKILVIEGCNDYIGLLRNPIPNYVYYMELIRSIEVPNINHIINPSERNLIEPSPGYQYQITDTIFKHYQILILNNAHYIPAKFRDAFKSIFCGKVIEIVDPFDIYGTEFMNVPTLIDSLSRQTANIAFARSLYHYDTRSIDRKVKSNFTKIKMQRRSIGMIDDKQYVSNDPSVVEYIRDKQLRAQFRKSQKFIVKQQSCMLITDQDEQPHVIGQDMMFSIMVASKPLMKIRIHSSKTTAFTSLSYYEPTTAIHVEPANILAVNEYALHRFNNVVVVLGAEPITTREWYTFLKSGVNISITDF